MTNAQELREREVRPCTYSRLPMHTREALEKDPMFLQRKHDADIACYRLLTGADIWPRLAAPATNEMAE